MSSARNTERYPLEIINAGMYRGGTSSLSLALKELGFGPTWHLITNSDKLNTIGQKWWLQNKIIEKLHRNEYVDFDEWLQTIQCKAIMDAPNTFYWDKIFAQYPQSKVIVCVRDFDSWSKSYTDLLEIVVDRTVMFCAANDPWLGACIDWWNRNHIGNGYNGVKQFLMLSEPKRQSILKEEYYIKHIEKAKEIVPREQLLLFNPNDGWEPLCKFLNVTVPNKPFPNTNNRKQLHQFIYEFKKKVILRMIKTYHVIPLMFVIIACVYLFRKSI